MATLSLSLSKDIYLNRIEVHQAPAQVAKPSATHHILVIDCSGSMSSELPKIRTQLKNKIATIVQEKDTVSIVWFSSQGECGTVVEKVLVNDAKALSALGTAVDRWLKPVGCTGFVDPLKKVKSLCSSNEVHSLLFLTDGMDNCWKTSQIMDAVKSLKGLLASATFVEYGWYCNRKLLADMAEEIGGALVTCENFDSYEPVFGKILSNGDMSSKWVEVLVPAEALESLAFTVGPNGPIVYKLQDGKVSVPEKTDAVFFYSKSASTEMPAPFSKVASDNMSWILPVRQSAVALSQRGKSDMVYKILAGLGDTKLFRKYANAFGKQAQADFQKLALDEKQLYSEGRSDDLVIDENAFTALDLLSILMEDDGNLLMIGHPEYSYNRIGRKTEEAPSLSEDDKVILASAIASAKSAGDVKKALDAVAKPEEVHLHFTPDLSQGVAISNLTWNESRPNVSAMFRIEGTVETPENSPMGATKVATSVFRNHAFIRDGIINVDKLPVKLTRNSTFALKGAGVVGKDYVEGDVAIIDMRALPVINRRMAKEVSAIELIQLQYELTKTKAAQKVYNYYVKAASAAGATGAYGSANQGLASLYGDQGAFWLEEHGVSDKGFNPKVVQAPATDFYMGVELNVSIDKLGSLPKVEDVLKKILAKKALTPRESIMSSAILSCEAEKGSMDFMQWATSQATGATASARKMMRRIAEIKFSVVIGQVWFKEFASKEEFEISVPLDGVPTACELRLQDVKVDI